MSERIAKIMESNDIKFTNDIKLDSGYGKLPSICPDCGSPLDFGPIAGPELICRKNCGYHYQTKSTSK